MDKYKPQRKVAESYEEAGYLVRSGKASSLTETEALFDVMMEDRRPTQEELDRFSPLQGLQKDASRCTQQWIRPTRHDYVQC